MRRKSSILGSSDGKVSAAGASERDATTGGGLEAGTAEAADEDDYIVHGEVVSTDDDDDDDESDDDGDGNEDGVDETEAAHQDVMTDLPSNPTTPNSLQGQRSSKSASSLQGAFEVGASVEVTDDPWAEKFGIDTGIEFSRDLDHRQQLREKHLRWKRTWKFKCAVDGCAVNQESNKPNNDGPYRLFAFPYNQPARLNAWKRAAKPPNGALSDGLFWNVRVADKICERHFRPDELDYIHKQNGPNPSRNLPLVPSLIPNNNSNTAERSEMDEQAEHGINPVLAIPIQQQKSAHHRQSNNNVNPIRKRQIKEEVMMDEEEEEGREDQEEERGGEQMVGMEQMTMIKTPSTSDGTSSNNNRLLAYVTRRNVRGNQEMIGKRARGEIDESAYGRPLGPGGGSAPGIRARPVFGGPPSNAYNEYRPPFKRFGSGDNEQTLNDPTCCDELHQMRAKLANLTRLMDQVQKLVKNIMHKNIQLIQQNPMSGAAYSSLAPSQDEQEPPAPPPPSRRQYTLSTSSLNGSRDRMIYQYHHHDRHQNQQSSSPPTTRPLTVIPSSSRPQRNLSPIHVRQASGRIYNEDHGLDESSNNSSSSSTSSLIMDIARAVLLFPGTELTVTSFLDKIQCRAPKNLVAEVLDGLARDCLLAGPSEKISDDASDEVYASVKYQKVTPDTLEAPELLPYNITLEQYAQTFQGS